MTIRTLIPVHRRAAVIAASALATALCASGCSGTGTQAAAKPSASSTLGHAQAGSIQISGAYIPQPASPDVAVAYFILRDTGSTGDVLLSATTAPASQATVMRDAGSGTNAETMVDVPGGLPIPAHGSVALTPGGYHLMLANPAAKLTAGAHVTLTLVLRDAGSIRLDVPVTSLMSDAQDTPMPPMPGM